MEITIAIIVWTVLISATLLVALVIRRGGAEPIEYHAPLILFPEEEVTQLEYATLQAAAEVLNSAADLVLVTFLESSVDDGLVVPILYRCDVRTLEVCYDKGVVAGIGVGPISTHDLGLVLDLAFSLGLAIGLKESPLRGHIMSEDPSYRDYDLLPNDKRILEDRYGTTCRRYTANV